MSVLLSKDRRALMPIVLPEKPTPQEKYAATELRYYLDLITSAVFDVVHAGDNGIIIRHADDSLSLGEDGFEIASDAEKIVIQGGKRGVIYGVYELLETLGVRFFTSTCEKVPSIVNLICPDIHTRQLPAFEHRDHNYYDLAQNGRFAVKSRLNGNSPEIKEQFGGHQKYTGFVHTFDRIIPAKEFGETHPEYFAMYNGVRVARDDRTQLCLTNPDVLAIAKERVRKMLYAHPETRILSVSQNDHILGCQCEKCLAADKEEGSPAGTLLRFVNAIAEDLETEFPNVVFDTLAYNYTRPVPRITKPRKNVCVRLCSIECCFSHPFETCTDDRSLTLPDGTKTSFINDLRNWGAYHDRLYIWDYTTCFAHYPTPHPNWRTLQINMQAFHKNHVKGVFEQANGAKRGGVDFNELRAYIITKLLWNPYTDVHKHIQEFTDYYYGDAGKYVRDYINVLCDKAEKDNIHVGFNDQPVSELFSDEMLDMLDAIMDKAEEAVKGDALRLYRISKARLSVRWVRLKRHAMLKNELNPEEATKFFTDWKAFGLSRIDEWVSAETTHRALLSNLWRGVEFYDHWINDEEREEF
ncbi:MAG: DUF4838 domain-containing protein [Clostridia bacterium]|nr:DUF4838 domain-containing protein [Clostridia bacterium]